MPAQHPPPTSVLPGRRSLSEDLVPEERVWLSRGLVALCQWRLEHILQYSDPLDLPLAHFLKEQIAAEEESADSLKRLDWALHRSGEVKFCSKEYDQLLSRYLPSAFSRSGEGHMDRDAALHFVEVLEAERYSFFSHVLEGLPEDLTGIRLKAESDRSADRLRLARTILLPPAQCSEPLSMPPTVEGRCAGAIDRRTWVVTISGHVNRLKELRSASSSADPGMALSVPLTDLWRPVVSELLKDLAGAASDADCSEEPLATRFAHEFTVLRKDGTRNLEDILGVARVALAWLMCGHTKRSILKNAAALDIRA